MFVRMVSDAKLYYPKRTVSQLARQSSLATPRARKRIQSYSGNHATRSSSETVNSDEGELDDKQ